MRHKGTNVKAVLVSLRDSSTTYWQTDITPKYILHTIIIILYIQTYVCTCSEINEEMDN